MFALFLDGGPIMFLLLACSVTGVYIIIHKFLFFRLHFTHIQETIDFVKQQLLTYGKTETILKLRTERKIIVKILSNSVKLSQSNREDAQDGIREAIYNEIPKIDQLMPILSSIITAAPILGLTGTVLGLMDIFNVISGGAIGDTQALSSGIATALITTVSGLIIAIPFIFFYQYLSQKIEFYVIELERMSYEMLSFCRTNEAVS